VIARKAVAPVCSYYGYPQQRLAKQNKNLINNEGEIAKVYKNTLAKKLKNT
jgi:hypothetical protein